MFKTIPKLTAAELRSITQRLVPHECGCVILEPRNPGENANRVCIRGAWYSVTRLIWAQVRGTANLDTHEVAHIPECPHAGDSRDERGQLRVSRPLCVNINHLMLATSLERCAACSERHAAYSRPTA